ncbi:MAG: hypothetical protein ACU0DW_05160 [Shimia sp.]
MEVVLLIVAACLIVGVGSVFLEIRAGRPQKRSGGSGDSGASFNFGVEGGRRRTDDDGGDGFGGDGGDGGGGD